MLPHFVDVREVVLDIQPRADGIADLRHQEQIREGERPADTEPPTITALFVSDLGQDAIEGGQLSFSKNIREMK